MPDLLSCPFCGKDAQIAPDEIGSGGQHVPPYHAGCLRGAGCGIAFTADDPDEAIAEWNRRPLSTITPAEVGGLVERLRSEAHTAEFCSRHTTASLMAEAATLITSLAARVEALEAGLGDLLHLNDNHSIFGGEFYHDRIDRTWERARLLLKKDSKA